MDFLGTFLQLITIVYVALGGPLAFVEALQELIGEFFG